MFFVPMTPKNKTTHFVQPKNLYQQRYLLLKGTLTESGGAVPQLYIALKLRPADEKDAHGQCGQSPPIGSAAAALWDQKIHF